MASSDTVITNWISMKVSGHDILCYYNSTYFEKRVTGVHITIWKILLLIPYISDVLSGHELTLNYKKEQRSQLIHQVWTTDQVQLLYVRDRNERQRWTG